MRDTNSIIKDVFLKHKMYKKYVFLKHKIYIVAYALKQQKINLHGLDMRDIYNDNAGWDSFYEITNKIIHGR